MLSYPYIKPKQISVRWLKTSPPASFTRNFTVTHLLLASDYNYIFPVAPSTRSGIAPPSYQTCMTNIDRREALRPLFNQSIYNQILCFNFFLLQDIHEFFACYCLFFQQEQCKFIKFIFVASQKFFCFCILLLNNFNHNFIDFS